MSLKSASIESAFAIKKKTLVELSKQQIIDCTNNDEYNNGIN